MGEHSVEPEDMCQAELKVRKRFSQKARHKSRQKPVPMANGDVEERLRNKIRACASILEEVYGQPEREEIDSLDLLIRTILSQNTSDTNSLRAFARLKRVYGDYELLISADTEEVAESIREGGLAETKARRIKEVLLQIKRDRGAMDIGFLRDLDKDRAMQYLVSLPGVGPKTASVVLLFAFGLPFFPVDTHVYRLSRRLGLIAEYTDNTPEKAQAVLERTVPREKYHSFHLNLIRHGRLICRARKPKHTECVLRSVCDCYLIGQKP